jgi:ubiquitin-protein ligase
MQGGWKVSRVSAAVYFVEGTVRDLKVRIRLVIPQDYPLSPPAMVHYRPFWSFYVTPGDGRICSDLADIWAPSFRLETCLMESVPLEREPAPPSTTGWNDYEVWQNWMQDYWEEIRESFVDRAIKDRR